MNGNKVQTFDDDLQALAYMQQRFGTSFFEQYEYLRYPFYSYQAYLEAGGNVYTFFNQTPGSTSTITTADTNMQTAGAFQGGWFFLVQAIELKWRLLTNSLTAFTGTDATTICSDLLMGFAQAGVLTWQINSFQYLQLPKPFLYAPSGDGPPDLQWAGSVSTTVSNPPFVTLNSRRRGLLLTRPVLIEPNQTFQIQVSFPGGAVPVIGTTITDDSTNPLKVGVQMDGILYRPVSS